MRKRQRYLRKREPDLMAGKFPSTFMPIRIGATVSHGANMCEGTCGPQHAGQPPHTQPNFRFTLLLFMSVMESSLPGMAKDSPFVGGPFTPPIDVMALKMGSNQAGSQLLRLIGWN